MIKIIETRGLASCPICNGKVVLRRNSGKRFQIKCTNPDCYVRTGWNSKTDTLCTWSAITSRLASNYNREEGMQILNRELQSSQSIFRDRKQEIEE